MGRRPVPSEKFLENYDPVTESGCWIWNGCIGSNGYGRFQSNRKTYGAHRFFFETYKGPIPEGHFVCHKCDTPSCVNPDHLFTGTSGDNLRDCVSKGRFPGGKGQPPGEKHPNARRSDEELRRIAEIPGGTRTVAGKLGIPRHVVCTARRFVRTGFRCYLTSDLWK